jgi:signal transduction histidine kinase
MAIEPAAKAGMARTASAHRPAGMRQHAGAVLARFRLRLRDRRFWIVQALVLGISLAHGLLEATSHLDVLPDLALLPVSTYFIPVVYAALNFGVEGAVPTALWISVLTVPNLILWHSGAQRPGVILQLALLVALAYVIARRVDAETAAKERAEAATARLARLNRAAAASARSLDLESVLAQTARAMLDPDKSQTSWVVLRADAEHDEWVTVASTAGAPAEIGAGPLNAARSLIAQPLAASNGDADGCVREDRLAIVALCVSGAVVGAVGLASSGECISTDEVRLLEAVANHLGVALANIRLLRQTQSMVDEISRTQQALEEYVRLATDAQEEERRRLARELHDDTIQTLVIAKTELDALAAETPLAPAARARLRAVDATLASAIDGVRRFSRNLRPSLLDDLGLVHAIDWLVADLAARTGIGAHLRTGGEPRRLDPKDELALFRIVQEALRNVERHAGASHVRVRLCFAEQVRASVLDDGTGFDTSRAFDGRGTSGLGLLGMRERAKLAGATLSIASNPAWGTRVAVTLRAARAPSPRSDVYDRSEAVGRDG